MYLSLPQTAVYAVMLVFVYCGVFACWQPASIGEQERNGCLLLERRADNLVARVLVGSPPREYRLLLRLDLLQDESDGLIRLWKHRALESSSVRCVESALHGSKGVARCTDVMLVKFGSHRYRVPMPIDILHTDEAVLAFGGMAYAFDGDMVVPAPPVGWEYDLWVKQHTMCITAVLEAGAAAPSDSIPVMYKSGLALTTISGLRSCTDGPWGGSPALHCGELLGGDDANVALFPHEASIEAPWLGLGAEQSERLRSAAGSMIDDLRVMAETPFGCRSTLISRTDTEHTISNSSAVLFDALCTHRASSTIPDASGGWNPCEPGIGSIPHRRCTADAAIELRVANGTWIRARRDAALRLLPGLGSVWSEVRELILALVVVLLLTATIFVHADDIGIRGDCLFERCLEDVIRPANPDTIRWKERRERCSMFTIPEARSQTKKKNQNQNDVDSDMVRNAVMAVGCTVLRLALPLRMSKLLVASGNARALHTNTACASLSIVHWIVRCLCVVTGAVPPHMTGGTSAVPDVCVAILYLFATPPIIGSCGSIRGICRMIVGTVGVIYSLPRCIWSLACIAVYITNDTAGSRFCRLVLCLVGTLSWLLQASSLAIHAADLVATPIGVEWTRAVPVDTRLFSSLLFLMASCLATTRLVEQAAYMRRQTRK